MKIKKQKRKEASNTVLNVFRITPEKNVPSDEARNSCKLNMMQENLKEGKEIISSGRSKTPVQSCSESSSDSSPAKRLKKRKKLEREKLLHDDSSNTFDSTNKSEDSMPFNEPYTKALKLFRSDNDYLNLDKIRDTISELERASEIFAKKMDGIDISIKWDIPDKMKALRGIKKTKYKNVSRRTLSQEEISYLNERLIQFCKLYNLEIEDIKMCSGNGAMYKMSNHIRLKFIHFLGKDLTDRTPRTLYSFLSRLGLRKGKFTEEEDALIIDIYNNYTGPNFHALCARLLNRHKFSVFKHFQHLKKNKNIGSRQTILPKATSARSDDVLKSIVYRMKNKNIKIVSSNLSTNMWKGIGNENNISPALAKAIFLCDLSPRLYASDSVHYYKVCADLISRVGNELSQTWETVSWSSIASKFKGFNVFSIYCLYRNLIEKHVPNELWGSLKGCIEYMEDNVLPMYEKKAEDEDFILKKIELMD